MVGLLRLSGAKNIGTALGRHGWKPWKMPTLIGLVPDNQKVPAANAALMGSPLPVC